MILNIDGDIMLDISWRPSCATANYWSDKRGRGGDERV